MQTYLELDVALIDPHPQNPNVADEASLAESIDELGWFGAVVVRPKDGGRYEMLGGEHRWRDRVTRGEATIPSIILHDVDDEKALKVMLQDNEQTRRGHYDSERLVKVLKGLSNLKGSGFDLAMLARHEDERRKAAAAAGPPKEFAHEFGIFITSPDEKSQHEMYDWLVDHAFDPATMRVLSI